MNKAGMATPRKVTAIALISVAFFSSLSIFPSNAAADVVSVQTTSILPIDGVCVPLSAYGFTPYVYDGALHSFEFTIPDSAYVALAGSAGSYPIPFQFMTRSGTADALRVHVNIATTPISGVLPLSVTLISADGSSQPVCMSTVIMAASDPAQSVAAAPQETPTNEVISSDIPEFSPPVDYTIGSSEKNDSDLNIDTATSTDETLFSLVGDEEGRIFGGAIGTSSSMLLSLQNKVVESCVAAGSVMRLWIILLAIYAIITAAAVLARNLPVSRVYSLGQRVATILTPLVLLLGFWYFVESCRATTWEPLVAVAIAFLGIVGLHRDDPRLTPYINRGKEFLKSKTSSSEKPAATTTMITPPPAPKNQAPNSTPTRPSDV